MHIGNFFDRYSIRMLVVDSVTKSFGSTKAVRDVSFTVSPGQVVGMLGPNGAGKTTTMRLIVGYLSPDSGSISLDGVSVEEKPVEVRKKIGYLPENNPLYSELLVSEALYSSGRLKGMTQSQIGKSLDFVVPATGLAEVYHRPTRELSKGYRQRLGIAMALVHQPDVLILDEPTEGLDPNQRNEIRALLRTLAKNKTVIISTHVLQEVSALCDRIIIINQGKIVTDQKTSTLTKSKEAVFQVVLEGEGLLTLLRQDARLTILSSQSKQKKLVTTLASKGKVAIPKVLSELQQRKHFTIWSLQETTTNLEEVFLSVTKEETL